MKVKTTLVTTVRLPNGEDDYFIVLKNRHAYLRCAGQDRDVYLWPIAALQDRMVELLDVAQQHVATLSKE